MDKRIFYIGTPCKRCGSVERYISSCNCRKCKAEYNRSYNARRAEAEGREYRPRYPQKPLKDNAVTHAESTAIKMIKILVGIFMQMLKKNTY